MRYVPAALDEHSAAAACGLTASRLATKDTASPVRATDRLRCFIASSFVPTTGDSESIATVTTSRRGSSTGAQAPPRSIPRRVVPLEPESSPATMRMDKIPHHPGLAQTPDC